MIQLPIGTIQTMKVDRRIETGYVLQYKMNEVLLHHNETNNELLPGEDVEVFLYQDKKGQAIATAILPAIVIDNFDWAEVVEVIPNLGVFVNIGTTKEILVSKDDLPLFEDVWPIPGDKLYVTLGKDRKGRLLALPATESVIAKIVEIAPDELFNTTISGRVYRTDREGSAIITAENYRGFIHHTERKVEPRLGELVQGRVIEVKADGTLNVSLRPYKRQGMAEDAEMVLAYLIQNDGVMPFTDKSDPDDIRGTFNISKAAFKRALGKLMKEGKIDQRDEGTFLQE